MRHVILAVLASLVLGALSLLLSPLWVLAGIAGIAALVLVARRPELGLLAMVVVTAGLIDAESLPWLSIGPISLHLTDLLLLYMLGILIVRALIDPSFRVVTTPLDFPMLAFYGALAYSAFMAIGRFSIDPNNVLRQLRPLTYYLAFFVVTNLIRQKRQLDTLVSGLMLIAVVASVALIGRILARQLFGLDLQVTQTREYTLTTAGTEYQGVVRTYMQADRLVYPMLLVAIASLVLGLESQRSASRTTGAGGVDALQVLRRLFETAFLAVGIFLSFQRNYWITMLLMVGLLFLLVNWAERVRGLQWMTVGVVVLMVMAAIPGVGLNNYIVAAQDRLFRGMQVDTLVEDKSAQMRVMETEYALETVLARPVFGIGMGNVYRPWMPDDAYFRPEAPRLGLRWYAHNAYLWLWVMAGAVGLVPFLILYGLFIWRGLRYWRHMKGSVGGLGRRALVLGTTLAILGQMITNLVAPNFLQAGSLVIFAILLGVNEVIYRFDAVLGTGEGTWATLAPEAVEKS
jgi:O-antigen ligase